MLNQFRSRSVIIGNSGAGKTTLGRELAAISGGRHIALDDIYWVSQAGLQKRVEPVAKQMTAEIAETPQWVIEGVFGWLAEVGPQYSPTPAEYDALLVWAADYGIRQTPSSEAGHRKIFDAFSGSKVALTSRAEVAAWLQELAGTEQ
jgi:hypothetical protein